MGEKGSKDKSQKEDRKKPKHTIKEKRKIKEEKRRTNTPPHQVGISAQAHTGRGAIGNWL